MMGPRGAGIQMLKPDQMQAAKSLLRMIESNPLEVSAYCRLAGLYESSGYERIPCYPPYDSRALSLCFEKRLPPLE